MQPTIFRRILVVAALLAAPAFPNDLPPLPSYPQITNAAEDSAGINLFIEGKNFGPHRRGRLAYTTFSRSWTRHTAACSFRAAPAKASAVSGPTMAHCTAVNALSITR